MQPLGPQESAVQGLLSSQLRVVPGVQAPALQISSPLQTLPSEQEVPSATGLVKQPVAGSQASVVQPLLSLQTRGVPGAQRPCSQVSEPLQASPSEQEVPSATGVWAQPLGPQESAVQGFWSSQLRVVPGVQAPALQISSPLQTSPSEQEVPSATGVRKQPLGPQESVVQGLLSSQLRAVPGVQAPALQISSPLQTLPSEQEVPSGSGLLKQPVAGSQASVVQALPSLQTSGVPGAQRPCSQVSEPLQASPSEQEVPSATGVWMQPLGPQESAVQGLLSSQLRVVPGVQAPALQISSPLQTLPSEQEVPSGTGVWTQPLGPQESAVQGFWSSQLRVVPGVQAPALQISSPLQTLP